MVGVFAGAETTTTGTAKLLHKLHLANNTTAATGDEKFLEEERTDYDESGKKEPGFASHAIPTLEEKTLQEQRPRKDSTDQDDLASESSSSAHTERASDARGSQIDDDTSHDMRTTSGASSNMKSPISDTETTPRTETGDDNKDYFKAAIRDTATTKATGRNHWTVPTKRPAIDKDDFEDPISDSFWKDRWVASAAHNVCSGHMLKRLNFFTDPYSSNRRRYTEKSSMRYPTTLFPLGSNIKNSSRTTSA